MAMHIMSKAHMWQLPEATTSKVPLSFEYKLTNKHSVIGCLIVCHMQWHFRKKYTLYIEHFYWNIQLSSFNMKLYYNSLLFPRFTNQTYHTCAMNYGFGLKVRITAVAGALVLLLRADIPFFPSPFSPCYLLVFFSSIRDRKSPLTHCVT